MLYLKPHAALLTTAVPRTSCCAANAMTTSGPPPPRGSRYPWPGIPKPMQPYPMLGLGAVRMVGLHVGRIPNCSEVPDPPPPLCQTMASVYWRETPPPCPLGPPPGKNLLPPPPPPPGVSGDSGGVGGSRTGSSDPPLGMFRAVTRACANTVTLCFRTSGP